MSNFQHPFAQNLRAARESSHLSQLEMSRKLGICRSAYTYYETGHTQPDLQTLAGICRVLGVSADSLLGLCGTL